jgi:hypothetical protein
MISFAGYDCPSHFDTSIITSGGYIINNARSLTGAVTGMDSVRYDYHITGTFIATTHKINVFYNNIIGGDRTANFMSSNNLVSLVDAAGDVSYVNSGNCKIKVYNDIFSREINIINSVIESNIYDSSEYSQYETTASGNVLVVYNSNSSESDALKNYYTGTRPMFGQVNILGADTPETESFTSYAQYVSGLQNPVNSFVTGSGKSVRYIVLLHGIPTRISSDPRLISTCWALSTGLRQNSDLGYSGIFYGKTGEFILDIYRPEQSALVTFITADSYGACSGYIARISQGQTGLFLTGESSNFYCDDYHVNGVNSAIPNNARSLSGAGVTGEKNIYSLSSHIYSGSDVAGYLSWGTNGGLPKNYHDIISWTGHNWYVIGTSESFNGQRSSAQNSFTGWFGRTAFGGTNYENCPVGAMCHTEEPGGPNFGDDFLKAWNSGIPFARCAWGNNRQNKQMTMIIGDPFVCKSI